MTQQKALKRRVRARMARTGERYTSARANVIGPPQQAPGSAEAVALPPTDVSTPAVPDSPFRGTHGASDEALVERTGNTWAYWYRLLDAWGAADRSHTEIARWLHADQGVDGWWAQEITVRFEMAIGRRQPGQRSDGFEATAAKTVAAAPERVYETIVDDGERSAWLGRSLPLRKATQSRSASAFATIRLDWDDAPQRIVLWLADKGDRTTISMAHQRLPNREAAIEMKTFWRERLAVLAARLKGSA